MRHGGLILIILWLLWDLPLVQLDKQAQIHCLYPHPQWDVIQLNAPDYDPDIGRQLDPVTDVQSLNAETVKENTLPDTSKSEHCTAIPQITNRHEPQPSEVSADTDHTEYHSIMYNARSKERIYHTS